MGESREKVLVLFVDAFGPEQLKRFGERLSFLPHQKSLEGILGYSSGAIPTILTGQPPSVHGRMCLFTERPEHERSILSPLTWLGLLPRIVHERPQVRRVVERALARTAGLTGYVALHKVPPEHFRWLDLPERDDMFHADAVGGARTFLADARDAGLSVYASPWQLPEAQRWRHAHRELKRIQPDLAFLYAAELDGVMHSEGSTGERALDAMDRIATQLARARELMAEDGSNLTTLLVGDHGMADVHTDVDPRPVLARLGSMRLFVDATMARFWGSDAELDRARVEIEREGWQGRWLDERNLRDKHVPMTGAPYGKAMFVLDEGALFVPNFLGGHVAGMHGYDLGTHSSKAALASDHPVGEGLNAIVDLASVVRSRLGLGEGT